jgi:hypothetical protein
MGLELNRHRFLGCQPQPRAHHRDHVLDRQRHHFADHDHVWRADLLGEVQRRAQLLDRVGESNDETAKPGAREFAHAGACRRQVECSQIDRHAVIAGIGDAVEALGHRAFGYAGTAYLGRP